MYPATVDAAVFANMISRLKVTTAAPHAPPFDVLPVPVRTVHPVSVVDVVPV